MELESRLIDATRLACRQVVENLITKHQWALIEPDELVEAVLETLQGETSAGELERSVIHQYTIVLYEACKQTADPKRQEQGYREVHRFLFRSAYQQWPDLAEIVAQRALVLVHAQLDRCRNPGTFGAFALNKLRQAYKDELRDKDKTQIWSKLRPDTVGVNTQNVSSQLNQQETLTILVNAVRELPDVRQSKVILLKFFAGLSDEGIANQLNLSVSNVRVLRYRGLTHLRKNNSLRNYFLGE